MDGGNSGKEQPAGSSDYGLAQALFMETEEEYAESEAKHCSGDEQTFWNSLLLIFMKPGDYVAYTCEAAIIFLNEF